MAGINLIRSQLLEKYLAEGMSYEEALMKANAQSKTEILMPKPKPKKPSNTWRKLKEVFYGKHMYENETPAQRKKRVKEQKS